MLFTCVSNFKKICQRILRYIDVNQTSFQYFHSTLIFRRGTCRYSLIRMEKEIKKSCPSHEIHNLNMEMAVLIWESMGLYRSGCAPMGMEVHIWEWRCSAGSGVKSE